MLFSRRRKGDHDEGRREEDACAMIDAAICAVCECVGACVRACVRGPAFGTCGRADVRACACFPWLGASVCALVRALQQCVDACRSMRAVSFLVVVSSSVFFSPAARRWRRRRRCGVGRRGSGEFVVVGKTSSTNDKTPMDSAQPRRQRQATKVLAKIKGAGSRDDVLCAYDSESTETCEG